jgi:hypothetical protein
MERRALMKSVALGVMGTTLVGSGQLARSASNPAQPPARAGSFVRRAMAPDCSIAIGVAEAPSYFATLGG